MAKYRAVFHAVIPSEEDGPMKLLGGTLDSSLDLESNDLSALTEYLYGFFEDFAGEGLEEYRIELYELDVEGGREELVGLRVSKSGSGG